MYNDNYDFSAVLREQGEVITEAVKAIQAAMIDGARHGYRGKWRQQSFEEHLNRAIIHLLNFKLNGTISDGTHALCRIGMAFCAGVEKGENGSDKLDNDGEKRAAGTGDAGGQQASGSERVVPRYNYSKGELDKAELYRQHPDFVRQVSKNLI